MCHLFHLKFRADGSVSERLRSWPFDASHFRRFQLEKLARRTQVRRVTQKLIVRAHKQNEINIADRLFLNTI